MRSSTLPSPELSICHDTKVFRLAQLGSVAGSARSCVLNDSTMPWAPESIVAPTMSVRGEASLSLVLRSIVSPTASVSAAGPAAAKARGAIPNPVTVSSAPIVNARLPARFLRTNLAIRHPQSQAPGNEEREHWHASRGQLGRDFDTGGAISSQMSQVGPAGPYVHGTSASDKIGAVTSWSARDIPDLSGRVAV